jgi:hypothetical protein
MKTRETKRGTYSGSYLITSDVQEIYLGSTSPREFDSEDEINKYFTRENLAQMFACVEYEVDMDEARAVRDWAIHEWRKVNR